MAQPQQIQLDEATEAQLWQMKCERLERLLQIQQEMAMLDVEIQKRQQMQTKAIEKKS